MTMQWWDNRKLAGKPLRDVKLGSKRNCVYYRTRDEAYTITKRVYRTHGPPEDHEIMKWRKVSYCKQILNGGTCASLRRDKRCVRMRK